ncbi:MAG: hypothetical protein WDM88_06320 [Galbitalea sp.]
MWFIAELADVPVLIILFVRWTRVDRKEARSYDDLSDEEMDVADPGAPETTTAVVSRRPCHGVDRSRC